MVFLRKGEKIKVDGAVRGITDEFKNLKTIIYN
jgi:hypothetical protein